MAIQRARSIDDIYEDVSGADIVLSTEGPLTLALDRRLEKPRLGRLSATPRSHASGQMVPEDQRPIFLAVVERTTLTWKEAAFAVQHILDCWDRTGDPTNVLQAQYDTPAMREALAVVQDERSSYSDLNDTDPVTGDVVVAGEDFFTPLDRTVVPEEYEAVDLFEAGTFDPPEFRVFDSPTGIVDTLVDHITAENADDVAVVVNRGSRHATLVEAAFAANDIPYRGGPGFENQPHVRTLLRFLRAAFDSDDLRLSDVRPVLVQMGIDPPVEDENRRLSAVDHEAIQEVVAFVNEIPTLSFEEVLEAFGRLAGRPTWDLENELEKLGLLQHRVTQSRIDDLEFYLDAFEVPFETSNDGVLLASATSSVYVDRPTVFYVGLDRGWERSVPERPWVDAEREDRQNLQRFQLLLQNGTERQYLVVNSNGGEPVTPCLYFEDILDQEFETFSDLPSTRHGPPSTAESEAFAHNPPADVPPSEPVTSLSQSTLSTLVNCPREYYVSELVEDPTNHYLQRGTAFHDVAELYAVAPEIVRENREAVLDWLVDEQRPFLDQHDVATWRTTADVGLDLLTEYLDDVDIAERVYEGYEPFGALNGLAAHLEQELDSTVTEQWFENPALGGHGVVDLVQDPTTLVDYKTGSQSTASSVLSDGSPDDPSDTPDFQAYHYLAHHRGVVPDRPLSFRLVHFLEVVDDAVVDPDSVSVHDAVTEIEYSPTRFVDYVGSESVYQWLWEDLAESNNRRKTLERMGYEPYSEFFMRHEYPGADSKDEVLASPVTSAFEGHCVDHVGDYKYVRRGARSTMKKLFGLRGDRLFGEDLDDYETFLETWIDQLNEYRATRFPVGDPNEDRLDHPLLIVGGDD